MGLNQGLSRSETERFRLKRTHFFFSSAVQLVMTFRGRVLVSGAALPMKRWPSSSGFSDRSDHQIPGLGDEIEHPSWRACCPLPTEKVLPQSARTNIIAGAF